MRAANPRRLLGAAAPPAVHTPWDAYLHWLKAAVAVRQAYDQWSSASSADTLLAFAAYQAALDREEHAARWVQALAT